MFVAASSGVTVLSLSLVTYPTVPAAARAAVGENSADGRNSARIAATAARQPSLGAHELVEPAS